MTTLTARAASPTRPHARNGGKSDPARRAERRPAAALRLTRRGRIVVVLLLLVGLLALGFSLGHVAGSQAAGATAGTTVVVQPGDTLWSIAARVAPDRDPRALVSQLRALNHLPDASVQTGDRLRVTG